MRCGGAALEASVVAIGEENADRILAHAILGGTTSFPTLAIRWSRELTASDSAGAVAYALQTNPIFRTVLTKGDGASSKAMERRPCLTGAEVVSRVAAVVSRVADLPC